MLSLDGVEQQRHRAPFADPLRPTDSTARYGDRIDGLARELVSSLAPLGRAELRRALAGPLAVAVSAMVLGLDTMDPTDLLTAYDRIVAAVDGVSRGEPVSAAGRAAFAGLADEIRAAMRRDGTLAADVAAALEPDEVVSNSAVFLFGGIETSEGMTSNALHHLLADPMQWHQVEQDRTLVEAAVEESLRLEPAAARVDRYATAEVELAGARICRGDLVVVSIAGANRDPAVFRDPNRFDVRRTNARSHVAFAHGPHACIGAQLARLQTRAALHAVMDLLPGITLTDEPVVGGVIFRKPVALHTAWPRR
jgi:cytochrome P450